MSGAQRCIDLACADGPRDDPALPQPRWATAGLLCSRCGALLEQRLAEIPARHTLLRSVLGGMQAAPPDGSRPTKGNPPTPLNIDAHDHLDLLHQVVASWACQIAQQRQLRGPDRRDVQHLAPWLVSQIDWIVEQDWVGDLAEELRDLSNLADTLTRWRRGWHPLPAPCPGCDQHALGRWDGDDHVSCAECGERWAEDDYRRLVTVLANDARSGAA